MSKTIIALDTYQFANFTRKDARPGQSAQGYYARLGGSDSSGQTVSAVAWDNDAEDVDRMLTQLCDKGKLVSEMGFVLELSGNEKIRQVVRNSGMVEETTFHVGGKEPVSLVSPGQQLYRFKVSANNAFKASQEHVKQDNLPAALGVLQDFAIGFTKGLVAPFEPAPASDKGSQSIDVPDKESAQVEQLCKAMSDLLDGLGYPALSENNSRTVPELLTAARSALAIGINPGSLAPSLVREESTNKTSTTATILAASSGDQKAGSAIQDNVEPVFDIIDKSNAIEITTDALETVAIQVSSLKELQAISAISVSNPVTEKQVESPPVVDRRAPVQNRRASSMGSRSDLDFQQPRGPESPIEHDDQDFRPAVLPNESPEQSAARSFATPEQPRFEQPRSARASSLTSNQVPGARPVPVVSPRFQAPAPVARPASSGLSKPAGGIAPYAAQAATIPVVKAFVAPGVSIPRAFGGFTRR